MKKEVAGMLANALRSGKYTQGTGPLVVRKANGKGHTFTAAGVLCHIAAAAGYAKRVLRGGKLGYLGTDGDFTTSRIPASVGRFAGVSCLNLSVKVRKYRDKQATNLYVLNDTGITGDAWTFKTLAGLLDKRGAEIA